MRHVLGRGPVWEYEDQIHITGTRSKRYPCGWFFRSRLTDVAPYLSFAPPTSPTASRSLPLLSGDDRSSVFLSLGDQRPHDACCLVGQRHDFSDPNHPWYCSILRTSQSIVREGAAMLENASVVVVAYPLNCLNWIYFRRRFAEVGATALFVTLRASYEAIVDNNRGRAFNAEEDDRIRVMIAEGYDRRPFSNLIIDTDRTDFAMTLAELEISTRRLLAS